MKKLLLILGLLSLSHSFVWAEDPPATTTDANASGTSDANTPSGSSNKERVMPTPQETRIAGLIAQLSGNQAQQIEQMSAENDTFLGLFRESETGDPQGCVIILHGDHGHPDWPQVVAPLRDKLPSHSWCTLSIEVPDMLGRAATVPNATHAAKSATPSDTGAAPDAPQSDTTPPANDTNSTSVAGTPVVMDTLPNESQVFARIDAAANLIKEKGYTQVAYLGYRTGAAYALRYAAEKGITSQALMLIEPRTSAPITEYQLAQTIQTLKLPVLDYYFNRTFMDARFAGYRQAAANKRSNRKVAYTQIDALPDARFDPSGNKRLTQRVWGFLKQNTNQQGQRKELPEFEKELFYKSPVD